MRHNFDRVPSRQNPAILNKWTFYPADVLPLWLADMDFPTAPSIADALQAQIQHGVLGYELPSRSLRETIARRMMKLYGWNVDPDSIVYTAGVNNGYNIAVRDDVALGGGAFGRFANSIGILTCEPVPGWNRHCLASGP